MKPKMPIPTAVVKPTKKDRRDAMYRLHTDLTNAVKQGFAEVEDDKLGDVLAGYMSLMVPPEDAEEITMTPDEAKQTALLAAQAVSRQLLERMKGK